MGIPLQHSASWVVSKDLWVRMCLETGGTEALRGLSGRGERACTPCRTMPGYQGCVQSSENALTGVFLSRYGKPLHLTSACFRGGRRCILGGFFSSLCEEIQ